MSKIEREAIERFQAETLDAVNIARRVLDDPEALEDERVGSLAAFARKILHQNEKTQAAIAANEPDEAAAWAFMLGKSVAEAALKCPSKRGSGRPKGSGAVQNDAELIESIMRALASGEPGQSVAKKVLTDRGINAGIGERAKYAVSLARARLAVGK